jgi:hypothetical protein
MRVGLITGSPNLVIVRRTVLLRTAHPHLPLRFRVSVQIVELNTRLWNQINCNKLVTTTTNILPIHYCYNWLQPLQPVYKIATNHATTRLQTMLQLSYIQATGILQEILQTYYVTLCYNWFKYFVCYTLLQLLQTSYKKSF